MLEYISGHSLRVGSAISLAQAGATVVDMQNAGRWKSPQINQIRQIVETVNGQLTQQFHIKNNHAHTFWGVCTRLYAKITAHTLSIYLNQLTKKVAFLQIKHLAFPAP